MERNTNNNMLEEASEFFDFLQQNNKNNENYYKKGNNPINNQKEKQITNLKYNIEISIPKIISSKNKKNPQNIFRNKPNPIKLNYGINDYFNKGFNEKRNKKNTKIKRRNKNNVGINKFIKSNDLLNHLEYKTNNTLDSKKFKRNLNSGLEFTLKTSNELNKINNNKLIYSSSLNNLKEYTNKTTNNITSNFSQTINTHNLSIKLPLEESMKNEILDILNLNNNIQIKPKDLNNNKILSHSNSSKSFSFNRRKKPFIKTKNYLTDDIIDSILQSSNEFNNKKEDEDENKIMKLEKEINKIKEEYNKIKQEKNNLETSNMIMQNEMKYFYKQKELEKNNFEKYKQNEIKKLIDERNKISKENQSLKELKKKLENNNISDNKTHSNNYMINPDKKLIETYKIKLDVANGEIEKLKNILKDLNINYDADYKKYKKENQIEKENNNNNKDNNESNILSDDYDESEDNDDDNYDLILPDIYHKENYKLIRTEKNKEGSIIKIYDKNKTEINFINGDRKEIYNDIYEIIYYSNGDIKQIFKDKNKKVFFFKKQKITKTTLAKGLQIIKYNDNNQLEKIFLNGTKKISFSDGRLTYILPNGLQETYFPDGRIERKLKDGNIILEYGKEKKS